MASTKNTAPAVKDDSVPGATLKEKLHYLQLRLDTVYSVAVTVADALKLDDIEHNVEYAQTLRRCVVDEIGSVVRQLAGLVFDLPAEPT